jgi:peptidoglycan/LPS O-acetylase OafA/YrhL
MENRRRPIIGLDLVRFGAAIFVTLYHLSYFWWLPAHKYEATPKYWSGLSALHEPFRWGWVGVTVFFVVSGFVIAYSAQGRSAGHFVRSRVLRLYPAAWICATLTLVLVRWGATEDYLRSLALWPVGPWISGVYWTLAVEIAFYATVAFALMLKVPLMRVGVLLGSLSAAYWLGRSIDFATGGHFKAIFADELAVWMLIGPGCYFSLGIMLWSISAGGSSRRQVAFAAFQYGIAMVALLSSGRYYVAEYGGEAWQVIEPALLGTIGIATIIASVRWNEALRKLGPAFANTVRDLGLLTYPLYLLHSDIGREAMIRMPGLAPGVSLAVSVGAMMLLGFAVVKVEPLLRAVLRWLFALRRRQTGAQSSA